MKNQLITSLIISFITASASAQETPKTFNFSIYGYANYEAVFDTRQVVTAREGTVMLYPANISNDPDGNDMNAVPNMNFLVISSRIGTKITGPDVLGAKASANYELDFLGTRAENFNLTRLRHGYILLKWEKTELMTGQYWHPVFVATCFPNTVSFAGGVPFYALNRAPQLRFTYTSGLWGFSAIAIAQSDFPSLGPDGPNTKYIRNSMLPEGLAQIIYRKDKFLAGGTMGYQVLKPRIKTLQGYRTDETMKAITANIFATIPIGNVKLKFQSNYGENNSHLVMVGGYGEATLIDQEKAIYDYTGIRTLSSWIDLETSRNKFVAGVMAGYIHNLGSEKEIHGEHWGRGTNIENLIRISPRLTYTNGPVYLGLELIYDAAAYGNPDKKFRFAETKEVANFRTVFSMKYYFSK